MSTDFYRWLLGPDFKRTGGIFRKAGGTCQRWDPGSRTWVDLPADNTLQRAIWFGDPTIEPIDAAEARTFTDPATPSD